MDTNSHEETRMEKEGTRPRMNTDGEEKRQGIKESPAEGGQNSEF